MQQIVQKTQKNREKTQKKWEKSNKNHQKSQEKLYFYKILHLFQNNRTKKTPKI